MAWRTPASSARTRRLALLAVLTAAVGLFFVVEQAPPPPKPTPPPAERVSTSTSRSTTPRRSLPTRTEADLPEVAPPAVSCPLAVIDADTNTLVDDPADILPATLTVALTPPVVPPVTLQVNDQQATFPAETAKRLQQLPFRDGTIYGEDPEVGLVAFTFASGQCTRLQVLVVGPPDPDALRCDIDPELSLVDFRRVVYASGARAGRAISVRPWQGTMVLEDVPEAGDGWVQVVDHPPIPFSWDADGCDTIAPIGTATVTATITNPPDGAPTWIRGCGVTQYLPPGTDSVSFEVPAVPCALEAWRTDGMLRALSPLVTLDPAPNSQESVEITLPEEQMAGLGIQFQTGDAGVTVAGVWPDSPAWHAGLRTGDRIVSVDGESVAGLQDSDFIVLGTGPVGTLAVLVLEDGDGQRETIEVERAPLTGRLN